MLFGFWVSIGCWIGILQQLPGGSHFGMIVFLMALEREILELWNDKCGPSELSASCSLQWGKKPFPCFGSEVLSLVTWLLQCLCLWRVVGGSLKHIVKAKDYLSGVERKLCVMPSSTSPLIADFADWGGNSTKMNSPEGREGQCQSQISKPDFSPGCLGQSHPPSTSVQLPS